MTYFPLVDNTTRVASEVLTPPLRELIDNLLAHRINMLVHMPAVIPSTTIPSTIACVVVENADVHVIVDSTIGFGKVDLGHISNGGATLGRRKTYANDVAYVAGFVWADSIAIGGIGDFLLGDGFKGSSNGSDEEFADGFILPFRGHVVDLSGACDVC